MATKIFLKKSVTAGAVPIAGDLDVGEIAFNTVDRKIYTKEAGLSIIRIDAAFINPTAPSNPTKGDLWYDTTLNLLKAHNGTGFDNVQADTTYSIQDGELSEINFTTARRDKLIAIEASADVTDAGNVAAAGAVMDSDISEGEGFLRKTGTGTYVAVKSNVGATTTPGTTDDAAAGYSVGSIWVNVTTDVYLVCVDATNSAAVWKDLSSAAGGGETNTASNGGGQGVGVWDSKSGSDLIFRNLVAASTKLTITLDDANNEIDLDVADASLTQKGAVELATVAEVNTGTDATRAVTPDSLEGSALQIKVDGIEALADVTDETNVTAAGALMDSELTDIAAVKAIDQGLAVADNVQHANLILSGDLTVNGTTTTINTNEVNISDNIIVLNADEVGVPSQDAGIEIERGSSANVVFKWNEATDAWDFGGDNIENLVLDGGTY